MRDYGVLMNLASDLGEYQGYLDTQGQKRRNEIVGKYKGEIGNFVYQLLKDGRTAEQATNEVNADIAEMSNLSAEDWHPLYEEVRGDLVARIDGESGKKPWQRTLRYRLPVILGVLVVAFYFGLRWYSATPVTAALETRQGLQQRAVALDKVIRYDDWASTRRGGFIKGILLWPIEPTEAELQKASELGGLILTATAELGVAGQACNLPRRLAGDDILDEEIAILSAVTSHLRAETVQWRTPPMMTVLDPIKAKHPC